MEQTDSGKWGGETWGLFAEGEGITQGTYMKDPWTLQLGGG